MSLLEGSLDIAGLLLDNGADIDYVDTDSRSSLYMMALENDVTTVEFLLNHGANTELKDCDGRTARHVAAWQGYTDIVQVLLLNGADVNSVDSGNRSVVSPYNICYNFPSSISIPQVCITLRLLARSSGHC